MTRFKLFSGDDLPVLEAEMNDWAASLPEGTKVRRTQLAATETNSTEPVAYVLVSYEPAPAPVRRCTRCARSEHDDSVRNCPRCGELVLGE